MSECGKQQFTRSKFSTPARHIARRRCEHDQVSSSFCVNRSIIINAAKVSTAGSIGPTRQTECSSVIDRKFLSASAIKMPRCSRRNRRSRRSPDRMAPSYGPPYTTLRRDSENWFLSRNECPFIVTEQVRKGVSILRLKVATGTPSCFTIQTPIGKPARHVAVNDTFSAALTSCRSRFSQDCRATRNSRGPKGRSARSGRVPRMCLRAAV